MKNISIYTEPKEIEELIKKLLHDPELQALVPDTDEALLNIEDPISKALYRACHRPLVMFDYSVSHIEWSHFTSWMGCIARRTYENKAIEGLYYLHELIHWGTMVYDPQQSISQWHTKMSLNEYKASTLSEAYVYDVCPNLRKKTFAFEIWADRFLEENEDMDEGKEGGHIMPMPFDRPLHRYNYLYKKRLEAMKSPDPSDFQEMQISIFAKQNYDWTLVWQKNWDTVETHVQDYLDNFDVSSQDLRELSHTDKIPGADDRLETVQIHLEWLMSEAGQELTAWDVGEGTKEIPFYKEAEIFSRIVQENYNRSGNRILES